MPFIDLFQNVEDLDGTPEGLIPSHNAKQLHLEGIQFEIGLESIYNTKIRIGEDSELSLGDFFKPAGNLTSSTVYINKTFDVHSPESRIKVVSKYPFSVRVHYHCL